MSEYLQNIRAATAQLEALKLEHEKIKKSLLLQEGGDEVLSQEEAIYFNEKSTIVDKNLASIEHGVEEAKILMEMVRYIQVLEADKENCVGDLKRKDSEKHWLQQELDAAHQKLAQALQENVQLEEENKHLKFLNSLKKLDEDLPPTPFSEDDEQKQQQLFGDAFDSSFQEFEFTIDDDYDDDKEEEDEGILSDGMAESSIIGDYQIPQQLKDLNLQVIKCAAQHNYKAAVSLCEQALKDSKETNGSDHPHVAILLNILANIKRNQRKYNQAAQLLKEAMSICTRRFGEVHPTVATSLNILASICCRIGKSEKAEAMCKKALEIREKIFGSNHPEVARQIRHLAVIYQRQGRYYEAEETCKRALKIYESESVQDNYNVTKIMSFLATCLLKQGKHKEAEKTYKEILTLAHGRQQNDQEKGIRKKANCQVAVQQAVNRNNIQHHTPSVRAALHNLGVLIESRASIDLSKIWKPSFLAQRSRNALRVSNRLQLAKGEKERVFESRITFKNKIILQYFQFNDVGSNLPIWIQQY